MSDSSSSRAPSPDPKSPTMITTARSPPPPRVFSAYSRKRKLPTIAAIPAAHLMGSPPALPQAFSPPASASRRSTGLFAAPSLSRAQSVPGTSTGSDNGPPVVAKRHKQDSTSSSAPRTASPPPLYHTSNVVTCDEGTNKSHSSHSSSTGTNVFENSSTSSTGRGRRIHASLTGRERHAHTPSAFAIGRDARLPSSASASSSSSRSVSCSPPYRWSNSPPATASTYLTCRSRRSQSPPYRSPPRSSSGAGTSGSRSPSYPSWRSHRSPSYSPPYPTHSSSSSSSSPAYSSRSSVLSYSADDDLSDMNDVDDDLSDVDVEVDSDRESDGEIDRETNESLSKALCEELMLDSDDEQPALSPLGAGGGHSGRSGREERSSESSSTREEREKMDEILSNFSSPSSTEVDQSNMDTSWSTCFDEDEDCESESDSERGGRKRVTELASIRVAAGGGSSSPESAEVSQGLLDDLFSGADEMPEDLAVADALASTSSLGDALSKLPHELMMNSLAYLDADALCVLCSVCADMTPLAEDWLLWSNLYVKRWPVFELQTCDVQWKAKFKENDEREVTNEMGDMDAAMRVHMRQAYLSKLVPRKRNEFEIIRRWRESNPNVTDDPQHACTAQKCAFYKNDVIYICTASGAVHFCSKASCKTKRYSSNGDLICAVTGGIIEKCAMVGAPSEASRRLVCYEDGGLDMGECGADDPGGMATRFGNSYLARFYELGYYSEEADLANVWAR